jgi:FMN phosphatase YigB (HAD superfamily)
MSVKFLIVKTYRYFRRWGLRAMLRRIVVELRLRLSRDQGKSFGEMRFPDLVDLAGVVPLGDPGLNRRIAVHAHIFYLELAEEIAVYLRHIPFAFDLFISTPDQAAKTACEAIFRSLHRVERLWVCVTPNRGRDIAPLFCLFGSELSGYDFIAHIHTKKSLYAGGGMLGWREYLLRQLLGGEDQVRRIFTLFADDPGLGLIYPQNYRQFPYWGNTWLSNKGLGREWCRRLGIADLPDGYFDYPAGSMFWARPAGLRTLFDAGILLADFPDEAGQTDGTLAHCLERLFALSMQQAGLRTAIVADPAFPSWSKWRFDHYLARTRAHVETMLSSGKLKIIAFDIFDTLVVRPSLHPETAKLIVATRMTDAPGGADFIGLRPLAENIARSRKRLDVNLDDIYVEYATLAGLSPEDARWLQHGEEQVERALVSPRPDGLALFRYALATGKPVALISDMFLSRQTIETLLEEQGIRGYAELYLSSDVGVRKDSGELYHHVLKQWGVAPDNLLMIGDNEHSDLQIPMNLGIHTCHVLRPIAMAAAAPRFSRILERFRHSDVNRQLVLGLVVKRFFHPVFYKDFNPADFIHGGAEGVGYAIVGPLIAAFTQWILAQAKADQITTLYFLAREGKLLKEVYDRLASVTPDAVAAQYLVVSRRAMTVPMTETLDDILSIASADYFPSDLAGFLFYRFGLRLDGAELAELAQRGLWATGRKVEVKGDNPHHLQPVLEAIADHIQARAAEERPGLLAYLQQMGLDQPGTSAVVDVGYSATIQGRLSKILGKGIHGYYLLTSAKAKRVCDDYGVLARGCYGESLVSGTDASPLWRRSFELEMLLSTDDAQVMYYETRPDGAVAPVFQTLSHAEQNSSAVRADIRRGVLAFVDDFLALEQAALPGLSVPCDLAVALYEEFIDGLSAAEWNTMAGFVLDDHYCGRGIVTLDQPMGVR